MIRKGTYVYSINSIKPEFYAFHFSSGLWIALGIRVLFLLLLQKHFMGGFYRTDPATSNVFGKNILAKLPENNAQSSSIAWLLHIKQVSFSSAGIYFWHWATLHSV